MNSQEIRRTLNRICRENFIGVFACDNLPKHLPPRRPLMIVANTDKHNQPGQHWISIYIGREGELSEYFDSMGMPPPMNFENFLNKFASEWLYNDCKLQSVLSHFCGHYCIMFCVLKKSMYTMFEIISCFTDDTMLNDTVAHKFICG